MATREKAVRRLMEAIDAIGHDGEGREFNIMCVVEGLLAHVPVKVLIETAESVEEDNTMQDDDDDEWEEFEED